MSCDSKGNRAMVASRANGISGSAARSARQGGLRMKPDIFVDRAAGTFGSYTVSPLPSGYGVTLGNALRRTLLSGVPGAAVTSVRVAGLDHEFSAIPHVREDMTDLISNLKAVRFEFAEDKPARLALKVRGEGPVTAGALECPPHVRVVNRDQLLLTGDSAEANVDLALSAETGYGYSPSEDRLGLPVGEIPIDAVFSPVRRANFRITQAGVAEMARTGHSFENVTVELDTDGTITPEAALRSASTQLASHFDLIAGSGPWPQKKDLPALPYRRTPEQVAGLQPRTRNALQQAGYSTVLDVMKALRRKPAEVKRLKGMGRQSFVNLLTALGEQNLSEGDLLVLNQLRGKKGTRQKAAPK